MATALATALLTAAALAGCDNNALMERLIASPASPETQARCQEAVSQFSRWMGQATLERAFDTDVAGLVRLQRQGLERHPELSDTPLFDQLEAEPSVAGGVCFARADFVPVPNDGRMRFERVAIGFLASHEDWQLLDWGTKAELPVAIP